MRTAISLIIIVFVVTGVAVHRRVRITPDTLVSTLRREVPPGTPARRLLAVLDSMRAEHSEVFFSKHGDSEEFRGPGRRVTAAIRDLRRGKLLSDGVFLVVALDAEDRVIDYGAHYSYTGP